MATTSPKKNSKPAPIAPAAPLFTAGKGKFVFNLVKATAIPDYVSVHPSGTRPIENPLREIFDKAEHNAEGFIPDAYWTAPVEEGGRGLAADALGKGKTPAHTRLRNLFNDWKKGTTAKPADPVRMNWTLLTYVRDGVNDAQNFPVPGVSYWFKDARVTK